MKNLQKRFFSLIIISQIVFAVGLDYSITLNPNLQYINHTQTDADTFYTDFRDIDDFLRDANRPSLIDVHFESNEIKGWKIVANLGVRLNWLKLDENLRTFQKVKDINHHFNRKGFIQKTGSNYRVKFGRDNIVWDGERTGTILSDNMPPLDQLRLDIWGEKWMYHSFIIDANTRNVLSQGTDLEKMIIGHRIDIDLKQSWKIIFGEVVSISKELSLAELNPFLPLYHNQEFSSGTHNVITTIGIQKRLNPKSMLFVQLDIHEIDTDLIDVEWRKDVNATRPLVHGLQTGLIADKLQCIYTQTSPHLYQHYARNNADFVLVYSRPMDGKKYLNRFMGYPLGGGVKSAELILGKRNIRSIQYRWIEQTPNAFFTNDTLGGLNSRHRIAIEWEKPFKSNITCFAKCAIEHHSNYRFTNTSRTITEIFTGLSWIVK